MKGLVVYHSKWGNCKTIAENIARGLEEAGHEITIKPVEEKKVGSEYDFLAAGSPTRMGRMTGAMRGFLGRGIKRKAWQGKPFIAFGTGAKPEGDGSRFDKYAARSAERIYDALKSKGLKPVAEPYKAYVGGKEGPLLEGEEERALAFGREAGKGLAE